MSREKGAGFGSPPHPTAARRILWSWLLNGAGILAHRRPPAAPERERQLPPVAYEQISDEVVEFWADGDDFDGRMPPESGL